jgi:N utilization substance protein B
MYEKNDVPYNIDEVIKENVELENEFVKDTVYGVINNTNAIDELANKYLKNWSIDRLGKTDQAILRMAIYEMVYTDTPDIICINEAVELAKLFSDDAVKDVINGVLDSIYHEK